MYTYTAVVTTAVTAVCSDQLGDVHGHLVDLGAVELYIHRNIIYTILV